VIYAVIQLISKALFRKPYYPCENRAMPPRLRYLVYFLDCEIYSGIARSCCGLALQSAGLNNDANNSVTELCSTYIFIAIRKVAPRPLEE